MQAIQDEKAQREAEVASKTKQSAAAMKALSKFCAANDNAILHMCLSAWREVLEEKRKEAIEAERHRLENMQSQSYAKALGCWASSNDKMLRKTCFLAWVQAIQDEKAQREADMVGKAKHSEAAMKALSKFCAANENANLQMCLAAWRRILEDKLREMLESARSKAQEKNQAQYNRAMGVMAQSSDSTLRRSSFIAWVRVVQESKQAREEQLVSKAKKSAAAMQAMSKLCSANESALLGMMTSAWRGVLEDKRKQGAEAEREQWKLKQKRQYENAMRCMTMSNDRVMRKTFFTAWADTLQERHAIKQQEASKMQDRLKRSASAMQALAKLAAAEEGTITMLCFSTWRSLLEDKYVSAVSTLKENLNDRVLRSLRLCRLATKQRTRRSKKLFLAWLNASHAEKVKKREGLEGLLTKPDRGASRTKHSSIVSSLLDGAKDGA